MEEEGLDNVFARHHRLAEATRRAVRPGPATTGPQLFCLEPGALFRFGDGGADAGGPRRRRGARAPPGTASTCRSAAGWGR